MVLYRRFTLSMRRASLPALLARLEPDLKSSPAHNIQSKRILKPQPEALCAKSASRTKTTKKPQQPPHSQPKPRQSDSAQWGCPQFANPSTTRAASQSPRPPEQCAKPAPSTRNYSRTAQPPTSPPEPTSS